MKKQFLATLAIALVFPFTAFAQEEGQSALSCSDFKPSAEALERFSDLQGACEAVVERDGELYGKFRAVVRRANNFAVTLYLPATDHTFTVRPESDARVLIGGDKVRPQDLRRGQEIRIYLSTEAFATPDLEEIALVTTSDTLIMHETVPEAALPTTASPWPAVALVSLIFLALGYVLRVVRIRSGEAA